MPATIHTGDALAILKTLPSNTYDAMLTDPPYGIKFMGKEWDKGVPSADVWREALRVLKPGAYALVACGTRTQHRMVTNLEDAGFEVRDVIAWLYGSGFPKSHDVSKHVDRNLGATRERKAVPIKQAASINAWKVQHGGQAKHHMNDKLIANPNGSVDINGDTPVTRDAARWHGYGTALKPAMELWTLVRKPPEGTIAQNVLKWGCGALNIDGSRVKFASDADKAVMAKAKWTVRSGVTTKKPNTGGFVSSNQDGEILNGADFISDKGRWPANVIHDGSDEVVALFPETKSGAMNGVYKNTIMKGKPGQRDGKEVYLHQEANSGSAARFFYTAKARRREREAGTTNGNPHPTVKPLALTTYLAKLLLPPTRNTPRHILTPYSGVGSELIGALQAGWDEATGIELNPEYVTIAQERIRHHVLP
jgi:DNA modification methylase